MEPTPRHGRQMRKPFRAISPIRTGDDPVAPVRGADHGSAARTVEAPDQPGTGASPDRTPIAYGIGGNAHPNARDRPRHAPRHVGGAAAPPCPLAVPRSRGRPRRRRGGGPLRATTAPPPARYRDDPGRPRIAPGHRRARGGVDASAPPARRRRVHAGSRRGLPRRHGAGPRARPRRPARPRALLPRLPARVRGGTRPGRVAAALPPPGDDARRLGPGLRAGAAARPGAGGGPASRRQLPGGRGGRRRGARPSPSTSRATRRWSWTPSFLPRPRPDLAAKAPPAPSHRRSPPRPPRGCARRPGPRPDSPSWRRARDLAGDRGGRLLRGGEGDAPARRIRSSRESIRRPTPPPPPPTSRSGATPGSPEGARSSSAPGPPCSGCSPRRQRWNPLRGGWPFASSRPGAGAGGSAPFAAARPSWSTRDSSGPR